MGESLPDVVTALFWDVPAGSVSWEQHRDAIVSRVLSDGSWDAVRWLRQRVGDDELRQIIRQTNGRRLSRRQIRFWQLVLDLPDAEVDRWLDSPVRALWDGRSP